MSTIAFRIEEDIKNQFSEITEKLGINSSTALRIFINKVIKTPEIIKIDLDNDLL
jgi:addiction module RelB/DinJ family antitoxin